MITNNICSVCSTCGAIAVAHAYEDLEAVERESSINLVQH